MKVAGTTLSKIQCLIFSFSNGLNYFFIAYSRGNNCCCKRKRPGASISNWRWGTPLMRGWLCWEIQHWCIRGPCSQKGALLGPPAASIAQERRQQHEDMTAHDSGQMKHAKNTPWVLWFQLGLLWPHCYSVSLSTYTSPAKQLGVICNCTTNTDKLTEQGWTSSCKTWKNQLGQEQKYSSFQQRSRTFTDFFLWLLQPRQCFVAWRQAVWIQCPAPRPLSKLPAFP